MKYIGFEDDEWELIQRLLKGESLPGSPMANRMKCANMAISIRQQLQFPKAETPPVVARLGDLDEGSKKVKELFDTSVKHSAQALGAEVSIDNSGWSSMRWEDKKAE